MTQENILKFMKAHPEWHYHADLVKKFGPSTRHFCNRLFRNHLVEKTYEVGRPTRALYKFRKTL